MSRRWILRLAIVATIVAAVVLLRTLPLAEWLSTVELWVGQRPLAGPLTYIVAAIISVIALTPGWISMTLAGLLFGFVPGMVYALIATTIGSALALLVGRTVARRWVERSIEGNERMLALDEALEDQAFTIVVLTRLALIIPFNVLNYAYGLTRISAGVFAAATAAGMLPIVAAYAYLGSVARDVGDVLSGESRLDIDAAWIAGVVVVIIVIVIAVVRRAVRRALEKRVAGTTE